MNDFIKSKYPLITTEVQIGATRFYTTFTKFYIKILQYRIVIDLEFIGEKNEDTTCISRNSFFILEL